MKFSTVWESDYLMNSNGFYVGFNMPEALSSKNNGDSEYANSLPPYARRKAFLVDEYLACPSDWMRSSGRLTSYFVPIQEGKGLWLDFNKNQEKDYHVAIVISIQGVNPITGMPCTDAHLEQYIDTCPKHNEKFGPNRYCDKCGYKWPKQNYISTTGNNVNELWLDGFRTAEGVVRQYILSKEDTKRIKRGVASNIIGEDRVYAIGLSFFLSKEHKKTEFIGNKRDGGNNLFLTSSSYPIKKVKLNSPIKGSGQVKLDYDYQPNFFSPTHTPANWDTYTVCGDSDNVISNTCTSYCAPSAAAAACPDDDMVKSTPTPTKGAKWSKTKSSKGARLRNISDSEESIDDVDKVSTVHSLDLNRYAMTFDSIDNADNKSYCRSVRKVEVDKMEVSAGANIKQVVGDDPEPLDFWRKDPESIICVNYASEKACEQIIKSGRTKKSGHKEGFLKEVPVGN